jgi:Domain of unknown function (DUF5668)
MYYLGTSSLIGVHAMPKRVFWPIALVVMGIIFLASNVGMLPRSFWNLWPLILIIVGLGGLLISDREEWVTPEKKSRTVAVAKPKAKAVSRKVAPKQKKRK